MQDAVYLFLNLAAIPVLVLYAIWPRGAQKEFLEDATAALRNAGLYGVIMVVFLFIYYSFVDVNYFANMHEGIITKELAAIEEDVDAAEVASQIRSFFSVRNFSVLALALYLVLSVFYALLFTALKRLFLRARTA